jgi:hypothetical protein
VRTLTPTVKVRTRVGICWAQQEYACWEAPRSWEQQGRWAKGRRQGPRLRLAGPNDGASAKDRGGLGRVAIRGVNAAGSQAQPLERPAGSRAHMQTCSHRDVRVVGSSGGSNRWLNGGTGHTTLANRNHADMRSHPRLAPTATTALAAPATSCWTSCRELPADSTPTTAGHLVR